MALLSKKAVQFFHRLVTFHRSQTTERTPRISEDRRRFISRASGSFALLFSLSVLKTNLAWAVSAIIKGVRLWRSPDKTRLVFDISTAVTHSEFALEKPERLVIDIKDSQLKTSLSQVSLKNTPIKKIRSGIRNKDDLRVVLDLNQKVTVDSFVLKPNETYGHRLVVDIFDTNKPPPKPVPEQKGFRDIVVAIDAGHGGEDPGAIAHGGGYEKHITLAIARYLAELLKKEPGFKPVMIRDGDYYVELRERTHIAREHNADLFVSIHADGFKDFRASGASVYALSRGGATSETARWLAQKENSTDQIGGENGISLSDKDDQLASVLLDLSMTSTIASSLDVGDQILKNMDKINELHKEKVEQAGFVVLKSPDIPSILVETGFITNPKESRKLKTRSHQKAMARSIFNGLKTWFVQRPPTNTLLAKWKREGKLHVHPDKYVVQAGDTLSGIAHHHGVSLSQLKKANKLSRPNAIMVGQVLVIPD
ncbi:N-acetylmuramoyl-L-alanine amidase [Candidatus Sororendozoicomonas aggregata]|uniref:N-acetylmuramoyl-L-alanine amidase n=1 Tax=Candidatus Sororendozoicomonas aggregata TaxID=3073239 RepID=UPI002ED0C0EA